MTFFNGNVLLLLLMACCKFNLSITVFKKLIISWILLVLKFSLVEGFVYSMLPVFMKCVCELRISCLVLYLHLQHKFLNTKYLWSILKILGIDLHNNSFFNLCNILLIVFSCSYFLKKCFIRKFGIIASAKSYYVKYKIRNDYSAFCTVLILMSTRQVIVILRGTNTIGYTQIVINFTSLARNISIKQFYRECFNFLLVFLFEHFSAMKCFVKKIQYLKK